MKVYKLWKCEVRKDFAFKFYITLLRVILDIFE
ncbi:MAG: hypothetical protein K0S31_3517 [Sphingobacterium multivorum]|jgi:hypothetical protein|nr:hypothetical protein [Sphingobacterium multivorum]